MAAFTVVGPGWFVEDLGNDEYPVFAVWSETGKKFFGVASSDGMEDLLGAAAIGLAKGGGRPKKGEGFRFVFVRVGPRPTTRPAKDMIEVAVAPETKDKRAWRVVGMRDVRPAKPKSRKR